MADQAQPPSTQALNDEQAQARAALAKILMLSMSARPQGAVMPVPPNAPVPVR